MLRISLRQLGYFVAAAQHGSTLAAARELHVSQPSISQAITALESHWGEKLFHRLHAQGLELTTAGERRRDRARELLSLAQALDQPAGEALAGVLSVAGLSTLAALHLPAIVSSFQAQHPQVELRVAEGHTEQLLQRVERGTLDLALLYDMGFRHEVELHAVGSQRPYVLLPEDHPLAAAGSVGLRALAREPFVLIDLPHSREYFLGLFTRAGLRPQVRAEATSIEMVRSLVAHGHGVSMLTTRPVHDLTYDGRRLACRPLAGRIAPQGLVLAAARGRGLSAAAAAFVEIARRHLQARAREGVGDLKGLKV